MKFCSECATPVEWTTPEGDHLPRHVCPNCETIFYSNPRIIAGCLPIWEDKVLMCRRNIEPRKNYWTLPAGFMENGETTEQGAMRETWEEAEAEVDIISLYTHTSIVHVNQLQLFFLAKMRSPSFSTTSESNEVALFSEDEIPWDEIAFPTVSNALRLFFKERRAGGPFNFHRISIDRHNEQNNASTTQHEIRI